MLLQELQEQKHHTGHSVKHQDCCIIPAKGSFILSISAVILVVCSTEHEFYCYNCFCRWNCIALSRCGYHFIKFLTYSRKIHALLLMYYFFKNYIICILSKGITYHAFDRIPLVYVFLLNGISCHLILHPNTLVIYG